MRLSQIAPHSIADARLRWDFAGGHHSPRNIAIGDHANRFQVLDVFHYRNFAAVVSDHHFGCLPHRVLRRAASKIGDHHVFVFHGTHESLLFP